MKNVTPAIIFQISVCLFGCKQMMEKTETIKIKNLYEISITGSLTKMDNLNAEASLQYGNELQEFYIIVIDETKQSWEDAIHQYGKLIDSTITPDLDGYKKYLMDGFMKTTTNENFKSTRNGTIENMPAHFYEIEANLNGYDVFYYYTFVEGKEHFYQILTWTFLDRKDKYKSYMESMTNSFHELYF